MNDQMMVILLICPRQDFLAIEAKLGSTLVSWVCELVVGTLELG